MFFSRKIYSIRFVLLLLCGCLLTVPLAAQSTQLEDCILIIGDSIPAGYAVSEVPGYGYPVIISQPFSHILDGVFFEQNVSHIGIYNLAVGASSLGSAGDVQYQNTLQYAYATSKRCQFAVVFPWINDLPDSADAGAINAHIQSLAQLSLAIHVNSPLTEVVFLQYYRVVVTELGSRVYGTSISPQVIGAMNQAMTTACQSSGLLGAQPQTSCLQIEPFLLPLDGVLLTSISSAQYRAENYRTVDISGQGWLNEYWGTHPNSAINVDGVHLNAIGKRRLALGLSNYLQMLKPSAFQTVAPF